MTITPRLPSDPSYWRGMSERIVQRAEPLLERRRAQPWWASFLLVRPSWGLGAAAVALVIWLMLPSRDTNTLQLPVVAALAPDEPTAIRFVSSVEPPDISVLLVEGGVRP